MHLFDEPKIDCHFHVLDPARFPYAPDVAYRPAGQEIGPFEQYREVMAAYGIRHALIVGPNSGYGHDNRCLLDAIARSQGALRGIAVVRRDASLAELSELKAQGVVGIAMNATVMGVEHYLDHGPLLDRVAQLGLLAQMQAEHDQMASLRGLLEASGARILIDHCGRPDPTRGVEQPGFQATLALGRGGRAAVKLSGYQKFSRLPAPHPDTQPFIDALVEAFTPKACLWATDWPFLRAPSRLDVGPLLRRLATIFPREQDRRQVLWDTPRAWLGFDGAPPLP